MPPSNAYLSKEDLEKPEPKYPLRLLVCTNCWLVQTEDFVGVEDLFRPDYAYFSSTSSSWLAHAKNYCEMIVPKLGLSKKSFVVEVACNDGYLLKNFVAAGMPCLGIEPTASTAAAAEKLGIAVKREFFTQKLAKSMAAAGQKADLIIGNNVYAHVPDINDFTKGLVALLKTDGVVTLEFPHLLQLIKECQFDTIYHEHFSYLSLHTVKNIFEKADMRIHDCDKLNTHGGSLRIFGSLKKSHKEISERVKDILAEERKYGLLTEELYRGFQARAEKVKSKLLKFIKKTNEERKKIVAFGAAAKGNTLLNFTGITAGQIEYVCDNCTSKQGKYLPGSHIPICSPQKLTSNTPNTILILAWNIKNEIIKEIKALKVKKVAKIVGTDHFFLEK